MPVIAPHVLYNTNMNAEWAKERGVGATPYPPLTGLDDLKASAQFAVLTPEECVSMAEKLGPDAELTLHPMMGGLAPQHGSASLSRFIDDVLPQLVSRGLWTQPATGELAQR